MLYYKIPLTDNCFDYPAGCILCCGYPLDGYYYCKFESVTEVGSDWVEITEAEFDENCPDFPPPEAPPVQEVIATSAALEDGSITLTLPASVSTGTLVKFSAPCDCSEVTGGLVIDGESYAIVDAVGASVVGVGGVWASGSMVSVLIDAENKKAFIQNAAAYTKVETEAAIEAAIGLAIGGSY